MTDDKNHIKIIGQKKVEDILYRIIQSNKIPYALLFTGKEGVGKEQAAIEFAKALVNNSTVQNKDHILNSIQKLNEPYIKYICALPRGKNENENDSPYEKLKQNEINFIQKEFEKKSNNPYYEINIPNANNIKINSIRDINRFISFAEFEQYKRVIIISNAHLMKEEAQNALLKNLEEPPNNVIFILTTPYPEMLRDTIISRCWRIVFENLSSSDVEKILIKYFKISEEDSRKVSQISMGSVKVALDYLKYDINYLLDKTIKLLRYSFGKKFNQAIQEISTIASDKILLKLIISLTLIWLSYYNKIRLTDSQISLEQFNETIRKFFEKYPNVDVTETINLLEEYQINLDRNVNPNIVSSNLVIQLSSLI